MGPVEGRRVAGLAGPVQIPAEALGQEEFLGTQPPVEVAPQLAVAPAVEGVAVLGEGQAVGAADVGVGLALRRVEVEEGVVRVKEKVWILHAVSPFLVVAYCTTGRGTGATGNDHKNMK